MAKENWNNNFNFSSKELESITNWLNSYNSNLNKQLLQNDFSNIAKEMSANLARHNKMSVTIGEEVRKSFENGNFLKNINALQGLHRITPPNFSSENFAKQIAKFTFGSQALVTNLNNVSKNIALNFKNINPIIIGIKEINESLYREINRNNVWSDLESVTKINKEFIEEIEDSAVEEITDITELRDSLIEKLRLLYEKAKTEIGKEYIWRLMNLISLILSIYSIENTPQKPIIYTNEIIQETHNSLLRVESKLDYLGNNLNSQNHLRIAKTDVNLRSKNKKHSRKIGLVRSGQIVIVLKIKHKWLYVSYVNSNFGAVHFGYVYKKYFDNI